MFITMLHLKQEIHLESAPIINLLLIKTLNTSFTLCLLSFGLRTLIFFFFRDRVLLCCPG